MKHYPPILIFIYINKINSRLVFKIKDGYNPELQKHETMKLFSSAKTVIDKTKNGKNVPVAEVVELALAQCNVIHNQYQLNSEVLFVKQILCLSVKR